MAAEKTASIGQPNTSGGTVPSAGDRRRPEPGACAFPVVGIGVAASAGGLEAMRRLLGALADEPGVALVIVPRLESFGAGSELAPEHFIDSTRMRVCRVEDNPRIEPNVVYVSPPGRYVGLDECVLRSSEPERTRGRFVIDHFLRSLARSEANDPVAVILSGTGSDGTLGARAIWAAGGLVIAQDPSTADQPGMARSAMATGLVDRVLAPEEIAGALVALARHPIPRPEGAGAGKGLSTNGLGRVISLLGARAEAVHRYTEATLIRRVRHRMHLLSLDDYGRYATHLRRHPEELDALANELRNTAADFFEDPRAWEAFRRLAVVPVVAAGADGDPIRVWVPGCGTGEEPYSVALLVLEELQRTGKHRPLQVFATELDRAALDHARAGRYPGSIEADVAPWRLGLFFTAEEGCDSFRVSPQLREAVLFAEQDLLGDAPFSQIDLVSCRNLLIPIRPEFQEKAISLLHYAMHEGGALFLGGSRTVSPRLDLFKPLDARSRIYRWIGPAGRAHRQLRTHAFLDLWESRRRPPLDGSHPESSEMVDDELKRVNEELQSVNEELESSKEELMALNEELAAVNGELALSIEDLEDRYANLVAATQVPAVCLDRSLAIRWFTPAAQQVFRLVSSDRGRLLAQVAHDFITDDLAPAARRLQIDPKPIEDEVSTRDGRTFLRRIMPYRTGEQRLAGIMIAFWDISRRKQAEEELRQLNAELESRVAERTQDIRRLVTLIETSHDAIYTRTPEGTIKTWNPGAERLYGYTVRETQDQPYLILVPHDCRDKEAEKNHRLRRGEGIPPYETRRLCKDGRTIFVSVAHSPIQDASGQVFGIATIARDITDQKQAEESLRRSEARTSAILETAMDAVIGINHRGLIQWVNPAAERMFGYAAAEMEGHNVNMLMPRPYRDEHDDYLARYQETGRRPMIGFGREVEARHKDGHVFPVDLAVSEVEPGRLYTSIIRDITNRRTLEREVVEIASLEQRRIGQDLHDSVGQEVTALNLLADDLAETLGNDPLAAPPLVERMRQGLRRIQKELRTVLRGLVPVSVDTLGLMASLADLVSTVRQQGKAACTFDCPEPVTIGDNLVATQLYLIAQEAVHNAMKHARPREIRISLRSDHRLVLQVQDDGTGLSARTAEGQGLGLRIMQNRAAVIGATLIFEGAQPRGTLVTYTLARRDDATKQDRTARPCPDRR